MTMRGRLPGFPNFKFLRMIPGQRDGSARWNQHIMQYLRDRGELEICKEAPAIYRFQSHPGMTHVDDFLTVAKTRWIRQTYIPLLEQEFQF